MTLQNQLDYLPTLLDGVIVPEEIDTDILKSQIMLDAGLRVPLYSEPETMKLAIAQWFAARTWTFQHLIAIIEAEYSPIENYDRNEDFTRTLDDETDRTETLSGKDQRDITETASGKDQRDISEKASGKDQRDITETASGTDTNERSVDGDLVETNEVSAFNASSYQPSTKATTDDDRVITDELTHGKSVTTDDDVTYGKTVTTDDDVTYGKIVTTDDDVTYGKKNTIDDNYNRTEHYNGRAHGNIGVTTNQQMIEQELSLLGSFNIYQWIAKQFAADLTLGVWDNGIF